MSIRDRPMTSADLDNLLSGMREIRPDAKYYAITLLADEQDRLGMHAHTSFAGYVDNGPSRETRVAAQVDPGKMMALWDDIGQGCIVVNSGIDLYIFFRIGGNALVAEAVAEKWQPDWLQPREVVTLGSGGFHSRDSLPPPVLKRAPTPKHRMRILKPDRFRCRLCGRSPDNHTDVELHLHHIRPWGSGGVTHDKNLITLCHTCHNGLDPHKDDCLFDLVGSGPKGMAGELKDSYWPGVRRWRERMREILQKSQSTDA